MNNTIKNLLPHIISILIIFIVMSFFFLPQYQGMKVNQGDIIAGKYMQGEIEEFEKDTKKKYYWNNSMFSGMPWRMLTYGREKNVLSNFRKTTGLYTAFPARAFIATSIVCYLGLILLGMRPWLALLGAIVLGLNVNNLILLEAGHNSKITTSAYFSLIFAGIIAALRSKNRYLQILGAALFGVGASLAIYSNHPQMLYYFLLVTGIWLLVYLAFSYKEIDKGFIRGIGFLLIAFILAITSNIVQLKSSMALSESTMRGAPILEAKDGAKTQTSSEVKGLEWQYAMQWSNGWSDVFSFVVPRSAGGASAEQLSSDLESSRILAQYGSTKTDSGKYRVPLYYGKLPFTSGPYYIGAAVFFLFILSLLTLPRKYGVAFGVGMIMIALLSLGKNFEALNRLVFETLPFYNKFRAPNSIFHATAAFFVVGAIWGLQYFFKTKDAKASMLKLYVAFGISGGICLILAFIGPSLFDFATAGDARYPQELKDALESDRISLLKSDALRSFGIIAAVTAALWLWLKGYIKNGDIVIGIIAIICLVDLWNVGRRYFGEDNWVKKSKLEARFLPRAVDKQIKKLEPNGRQYYRVHDMSIDPWNSSNASYHHNTIGGYNAAKQQRYQDLIERYLVSGNRNVLNMLNAKYFIGPDKKVQLNDLAHGNAWFVKDVAKVNSANEELDKLESIVTGETAVLNVKDFPELSELKTGNGLGSIALADYEPDKLTYKTQSSEDQLAVFSEVWYPKGWSVTIDGKSADIFRVNYILRALKVPAGSHEVVFTYKPHAKGGAITMLSSILLLLALIGALFFYFKENKDVLSSAPLEPLYLPETKKTAKKKRKVKK